MRTVTALLAFAFLLAIVVPSALASTLDECQVKIDSLRTATSNATFIGRNAEKDGEGLIGKLDSASSKLTQGKTDDALVSLGQFRNKVVDLDVQGKINHDDALALITGADDVITCIQSAASM